MTESQRLRDVYGRLHAAYGPQRWWPGETPFEVIVGAILTQSAAWTNVEKALLNLRVGRFEVGAAPFSRFTKKLTDSDYMGGQYQTTSGGFQLTNPQSGFELYGARTGFHQRGGFDYSVGVVNGSNRMYDNNSQKDVYASAGYKFGGYGVSGSKEELLELKSTDTYIDNSISLGAFTYIGRSTSPFVGETRFNRWGLRADLSVQKLNLYGAYIHGTDALWRTASRQKTNSCFVEADYVILPPFQLAVRYENLRPGDSSVHPLQFLTTDFSFLVRANIKLIVEARLDLHDTQNYQIATAVRAAF